MTTSAPSLPESLISTLSGHYYTHSEVFALEQEKIFETMWFCVVRSSDLDKPGAFKTVQVGRESVLVTRSRKGDINAFFNICRHRGARLCTEDSGEVKRAFQCPYHAWTYDLDGKLIAAPNLTKMPDIDRVEYGLRKIAVKEWLGYVWVCLADEPPSFEDTVMKEIVDRLGDVESIDHYTVADLTVGRRIVYDVKANWKLIIENFMECYHCATIHPELTEVLPEFADGYAAQFYVGHGARVRRGRPGLHHRRLGRARPHSRCDRGPGSALLRDHRPPPGVRQPGARPRHRAPDVPDGRRSHHRRMRLAVPARGGRVRA